MSARVKKANQPIKQTVVVEKVFPYVVVVRLSDGRKGYIRRREMSWGGDVDPKMRVEEGQKINAVIIGEVEQHGRLELSHKLTLPSPWEAFLAKYKKGDVISGAVRRFHPKGVFVRIWHGIDGFVPNQHLASWHIEKPAETFWHGDQVEVIITRIDATNKKVGLSIRNRMNQNAMIDLMLSQINNNEEAEIPLPIIPDEDGIEDQLNHPVSAQVADRVGKILIVEDQEDIREPIVQWMSSRGYETVGVKDCETAVQKIQTNYYNVCLVDLDLPILDGIAFIEQLRQTEHDSHVVIMTGSEWVNERVPDIEQLGICTILFKPLDFAELDSILQQIGNGSPPTYLQQLSPTKPIQREPFQKLAQMMNAYNTLQDRLQHGLEHIVDLIQAENGIIFHQNEISQSITVVAQTGSATLNGDALLFLDESPVKDVLRDGAPVFEELVTKTAYFRFRKLLQLLPFESCIGVPVGFDAPANQYTIFLFHHKPRAFQRENLYDTQSTAALLAVALENQLLEERMQGINSILLSGQLAAGFGHEVNNKLTALETQLRNLKLVCNLIEQGSDSPNWDESLLQAKKTQDGLLGTVDDLKKTVNLFQNLARDTQTPTFNPNQVIRQALSLLQPILSRERIPLTPHLDPRIPEISGSMIRLQQAILNILLNGFQHMLPEKKKERRLEVITSMIEKKNGRCVKIELIDSGKGIHKQLWKNIFNLGYSTREDGTGLGLYIAQSLVESLGGRLFVEKSFILLGTTFVIELPLEERIENE